MKSLSPELQAHLEGRTTSYVMCWKITSRAPGTVVGFTEHIEDIVFDGITYSARSGFSPSALRNTNDLAVDNFDVTFLLEFDGTAEAELIGGYYDYAQVDVFLINYADLTQGKVQLARGTLGEVTIGRGQAKAEIRGLAQELQQDVLELTSPTCRADLGDARCGVNLAAFTVSGTISSVTSNKLFSDSSRSEANDYFNGGLLTWTSGDNAQLKMEVKNYTSSSKQFELHQAMPYPIQIGDTYTVYRGCDKSLSACKNIFNNVINFRGEPYLPGVDQVMQFGGR
jgi:uncharacterized phage protein (TIGR02218 family)